MMIRTIRKPLAPLAFIGNLGSLIVGAFVEGEPGVSDSRNGGEALPYLPICMNYGYLSGFEIYTNKRII